LADDPSGADELLRQLKTEAQTCLADVRRLVYELRPPALDQLGLVPSLQQYAMRLTERDRLLHVTVESDPLPMLPAAVEVAAYRIVTEAMTNVARHARATSCSVRMELEAGRCVVIDVVDDGVGIPGSLIAGVGLTRRPAGCRPSSGRGGDGPQHA
jgi:signal transduction histidine kinase